MILFSFRLHRWKQIQVCIPGLGAEKNLISELWPKLLQIQLVCNVVCSPKFALRNVIAHAIRILIYAIHPKSREIPINFVSVCWHAFCFAPLSLSLRMVIWCKHIVVHIICSVICVLVQTLLSSQFPRILNSENKALNWYKLLIDILQMLLRDNSAAKNISRSFPSPLHATPHTWCDRNFVDDFVFIWSELIAWNYLIVEDILFFPLEWRKGESELRASCKHRCDVNEMKLRLN